MFARGWRHTVMYRITTPGYRKTDQAMRWALPDRVFFAYGACHVLAHAFLERHGDHDTQGLWLKPATGFTGNHIVVGKALWMFDYHGYSDRESFLSHTVTKARRCWPGWNATLIPLPRDVSEARSRLYNGLWLRESHQFLLDALSSAYGYLARFRHRPDCGHPGG